VISSASHGLRWRASARSSAIGVSSARYQRSPRSAYQRLLIVRAGRRSRFQYTTWYAKNASTATSCPTSSARAPYHQSSANAASTIGWSANSTA